MPYFFGPDFPMLFRPTPPPDALLPTSLSDAHFFWPDFSMPSLAPRAAQTPKKRCPTGEILQI